VRLISDEIYHGIVYGGEAVSAVEVCDHAIVVNSFSKYFSMTGWRVGWLVVPPDLVRPIERLTQNFFISVPTLSQHAAVAAFDGREELDGHVRRYRTNRDLLMAGLPAVGLDRLAPARALFISMPTSPISPTTAAISASGCWRKRASPRRPASTSIERVAPARCASPSRAPRPRWRKRCAG